MRAPHRVVMVISLTRIPLALAFVLLFQPRRDLFRFALVIWGCSFLSDVVDGVVARRLRVASLSGRLWDSLGDKAFYIGAIVALISQQLLWPALGWALLVRDATWYVVRIVSPEKLGRLEETRPFTNWHGYFLYATIALGAIGMFNRIDGVPDLTFAWTQAAAALSLALGVASIVQYNRLT